MKEVEHKVDPSRWFLEPPWEAHRKGVPTILIDVAMPPGKELQEFEPGAWATFNESAISAVTGVFVAREYERQSKLLESQLSAIFGYAQKLDQLCSRTERIEGMMHALLQKTSVIAPAKRSIIVPIQSLAPEPYQLAQPLLAVVNEVDEGYEAAVFDPGIFASGDTEEDAVSDLKSALIDTYERLSELKADQLGPGPTRQKEILDLYIRKA